MKDPPNTEETVVWKQTQIQFRAQYFVKEELKQKLWK